MRSYAVTMLLVVMAAALLIAAMGLPPPDPLRSGEARLTLIARGPADTLIQGRSEAISVRSGTDRLVFRVQLASIDTEIDLRNRHLRELLEVDSFPVATLEVARAAVSLPEPNVETEGVTHGDLTFHGVTHRVPVEYRAWLRPDGSIEANATLHLDVRDFGLAPPTYLGFTVAPDVSVSAAISLQRGEGGVLDSRQSRLGLVLPE